MSIKGIDAQIMITRAAELTRDTSVQVRKNELMQDFLTVQARAMEEHGKKFVPKTNEAEEITLQVDRDANSSGGAPAAGSGSQREYGGDTAGDPNEMLLEQLYTDENHVIDIQV